jgi:dienelactone hydrolase
MMQVTILKYLLTVFLLIPMSGWAQSPALFPNFQTESLTIKVIVPVPSAPEEVQLRPLLIKPSSPAPWSTIVLPSNCSGAEDRLWHFWVPELIKNNIAVVLVDSFKPRGFDSICTNQFRMTIGAKLQDVHQVLDYLRADNRFKKEKIAIGGHSTGAMTAFQSSFTEVQKHLERKPEAGYNAFIGAAASCELSFRMPTLQGPLLLISGEKDDWTPAAPCEAESKRLKQAAQDATFIAIPDTYHTFSTRGVFKSPRVMKMPADIPHMYLKKLSYEVQKSTAEFATGEELAIDQMVKKYAGFLGSKIFGAHVGGEYDKAPEVAIMTVEFLKKNGW